MMDKLGQMETRRNFLRMLSVSPFIANSHALAGALGGLGLCEATA
jgi:hypothetical protein